MNVIERIHESYNTLTTAEQEAATFILGHLTDVLISNSAELSQLSGISQPTLSRLYRKLGYKNASEFRQDIRRYHEPGAPEIAHIDITPQNPVQDQMLRDIQSLQRTYEHISVDQINHIAQAIVHAQHVAVIGLRNNYPMALHLREQLIQSRPRVSILPQPGQSLAEELVDLDSSDLAVLFGVRRRTADFTTIVHSLHNAKVPMVIIGDSTIRRLSSTYQATFLEADLNARILSSFTTAFSLVALIADTVATLAQQQANYDTTSNNPANTTMNIPTNNPNTRLSNDPNSTLHTNHIMSRIDRINQRFAELKELERTSLRK